MWKDYQQQTKDLPPRPLLVEALDYVHGKKALDLGSGALNDARFLKEKGFDVVAVDSTPPENPPNYFVQSSFEDFTFPGKFDLVSAQFSLPFTHRDKFPEVWKKVKNSLNQGGIFTGHFFGLEDEWNTPESTWTFHSLQEAMNLLDGFKIISFSEERRRRKTVGGVEKFWHVYHIIAKKMATTEGIMMTPPIQK